MITDSHIVDMIERANDARPFCSCGWHTMPVWRDGAVWLECASLSQPPEGRLARLLRATTARVHTHELIVDVPSAPATRVLIGQS